MTATETTPVVELRHYTLHPGTRDGFVSLFESSLLEPQEDVGIRVGGIFHDRADPDAFVWMRSFADMDARRRALEAFYFGPIWQRYRDAANAAIVDSDDVLLLRPTGAVTPPAQEPRPPVGTTEQPDEWVVLTTYVGVDDELSDWLGAELPPALEDVFGVPVGAWCTHHAVNDFPRLPVRDVNAFAWSATFASPDEYAEATRALRASAWYARPLRSRLGGVEQHHLDLRPTPRSQHAVPTGKALT